MNLIMKNEMIVPEEVVMDKICLIRAQKVMLDWDLAKLYDVETKQLKRAVKRNMKRFPDDFMFELTKIEYDSLRSQFGTLNPGAHSKYLPFAFTEQGIAQLSSVLNSDRAIMVNIQIIRIFTKLRSMLLTHKDLLLIMQQIENKVTNQDKKIKLLFDYLKKFIDKPNKTRSKIGFKIK